MLSMCFGAMVLLRSRYVLGNKRLHREKEDGVEFVWGDQK